MRGKPTKWKFCPKRRALTAERIRSLLDYDPKTGEFTWKPRPAGTRHSSGSITITVGRFNIGAHRLAWLIMTGSWPREVIDHKNGNSADNRWENLREATFAENARNRKRRSDNKSGYAGVFFYKRNKKWGAKYFHEGRDRFLGLFDTAVEAHQARAAAIKAAWGEFARID